MGTLLFASTQAVRSLQAYLAGEYSQALTHLDSLSLSELPTDHQARISILRGRILRRLGEIEVAENCLERARLLVDGDERPALLGTVYFQLGIQYKSTLEYHLASKAYERSVKCFRNSGHASLEQRARFNIMILNRKLGYLRKAVTAFDILSREDTPIANKAAYRNESIRLFIALEHDSPIKALLEKEHAACEGMTPIRSKVIRSEIESDLLSMKGDWEGSATAIERGIQIAEGISEENDLVGELLRRKARVLYELGEDERAFETAKKAIEVCERVGEIYEIGACFRTLGLLAERRYDFHEAENLLLKAVEYYRDRDEKFERAHSHREIALFYQRLNKASRNDDHLREAFKHAASAHGLFDEMGVEKRRKEMQTLLDELTLSLPSRPFKAPEGHELVALGEKHGIITGDATMTRLLESVATIAPSDTAVLITGETGTGKELFARAIHELSGRDPEKLVIVNCAAIPDELMESELFGHLRGSFTGAHRDRKGKFAQAHKGTIFLDEIGDLSARLQAKLLRVLQDGIFSPVGSDAQIHADVRVISATNRDLESSVKAGEFRKDLYFRLNPVVLDLPPLRKRGDDVALLARYFLHEETERLGRKITLDNHALDKIRQYPWPGNVRELQNFVRRMALFAMETGHLTVSLFPESFLTPGEGYQTDLATIVLNAEKEAIIAALARAGGNKAAAARQLGISRSTINEKIRRYDLTPDLYERIDKHDSARA